MTHRLAATVTPEERVLAQQQKMIKQQNRQREDLSIEAPWSFNEATRKIDVFECSAHYPLSTFIIFLAGEAAFYIPPLLQELIKTVSSLMQTLSEDQSKVWPFLLAWVGFTCPGVDPFGFSFHYLRKKKRYRHESCSAYENGIPLACNSSR
ncbi:hypothetical protein B9Z55_026523 [Caenorhabditis nigoni]|nr:hypothetical protein B9Z55_026523 [Caenorhabditis nigoni]